MLYGEFSEHELADEMIDAELGLALLRRYDEEDREQGRQDSWSGAGFDNDMRLSPAYVEAYDTAEADHAYATGYADYMDLRDPHPDLGGNPYYQDGWQQAEKDSLAEVEDTDPVDWDGRLDDNGDWEIPF